MGLSSVFTLPSSAYLPILVFLAELCVVTLATLRIIFISRGSKYLAPVLGFFEITIWLFAISRVMANLSNASCFLGFAAGFTLGNYCGVLIEKWMALGNVVVRIITGKDPSDLVASLRDAHFGVTSLDAQGAKGPVTMIFTVVRRRELEVVMLLVRRFDASAFYSVDEIQEAGPGIFPEKRRTRGAIPAVLQLARKSA